MVSQKTHKLKSILRNNFLHIPIIYLIFGYLWIFATDYYVNLLFANSAQGQTLKGIFYVSTTGLFLYFLVLRYKKKIQSSDQKLRNLENQFIQAQKMESMGILFGKFIHDLRNKIMILQANIELLKQEQPTCELCTDLEQEIRETKNLMNSYLQYARVVPTNENFIDISVIISNHIKMMAPLLFEHDIKFSFEVDPEIKQVSIDRNNLLHVLTNLVLNSRDAIIEKKQKGKNFESKPQIKISVNSNSNQWDGNEEMMPDQKFWALTVQDNGIGMDSNIQTHLFTPFFTTKPKNGTGLGLSAIKTIVDQLHGTIIVKSQPNVGSKFTLQFPFIM